jgi:hypothetical protein
MGRRDIGSDQSNERSGRVRSTGVRLPEGRRGGRQGGRGGTERPSSRGGETTAPAHAARLPTTRPRGRSTRRPKGRAGRGVHKGLGPRKGLLMSRGVQGRVSQPSRRAWARPWIRHPTCSNTRRPCKARRRRNDALTPPRPYRPRTGGSPESARPTASCCGVLWVSQHVERSRDHVRAGWRPCQAIRCKRTGRMQRAKSREQVSTLIALCLLLSALLLFPPRLTQPSPSGPAAESEQARPVQAGDGRVQSHQARLVSLFLAQW